MSSQAYSLDSGSTIDTAGLKTGAIGSNAIAIVEKKALVDARRFRELDEQIKELQEQAAEVKNRSFFMRAFTNPTRDLAEIQEKSLLISKDFHQLLQASIAFGIGNAHYVKQLSDALEIVEAEHRGASGEYLHAAKEFVSGLTTAEEGLSARIGQVAADTTVLKAEMELRLHEVGHSLGELSSASERHQERITAALNQNELLAADALDLRQDLGRAVIALEALGQRQVADQARLEANLAKARRMQLWQWIAISALVVATTALTVGLLMHS